MVESTRLTVADMMAPEMVEFDAARAWLDGAAPQQAAPAERNPLRTVTYVCPVCAASLEREE